LTSPNGARRLLDAIRDRGRDARAFAGARLAAIGPGTAEALASANLVVDLVPPRFVAESLLDALPAPGDTGGRLLLVRAAVARDVLPDGLRRKGWDVDVVEAYRTEQAPLAEEQAAAVAAADVVTFTSSSTVSNFLAAMADRPLPPAVAAIGPITAATAREHGLAVDVEAEVHTMDGLVGALVTWAAKTPRRAPGDDTGG
jgi:uroporphyrinogen-III synthase